MKLSTKARYAVTAMSDLALNAAAMPVSVNDIAMRQRLSVQYLEQLFAKLRRAGLVQSVRGVSGGYVLARSEDNITIAAIIAAVDEGIKTTSCGPRNMLSCQGKKGRCLTHNLWAGLQNHIEQYLQQVTLQDVCHQRLPQGGGHNEVSSHTAGAHL